MKNSQYLSPFRYPGGKSWLVPTVKQWLADIDRPNVFLEPFCGGGSIALAVAKEELADLVVMVELDPEIADVWEVILGGEADFERFCELTLCFVPTLENVQATIASNQLVQVERAFRTIVKNRFRRGGIIKDGAGLIKSGENGKGLASRWYPETLVHRYQLIRGLGNLRFLQGDALKVMGWFPNATVFADPPYTAGGKRAGNRLYTHHQLDHELLFQVTSQRDEPTMLTYDDCPEVRNLAQEYGFEVSRVPMKSDHHAWHEELVCRH